MIDATYSYYRKSTRQWIYVCDGITKNNNYKLVYSHRFKLVAFIKMIFNIEKDIASM